MNYAVISSSLNPRSRSRILARHAFATLQSQGINADWIDLQENPLPFCDGGASYGKPEVVAMVERINRADGFIVALPVYNFSGNAAFKNLVELSGKGWEDKVVGFLSTAGGHSSYMSIMAVADGLMLDFRTVIVPRYVYAVGADFADGQITSEKVRTRTEQLATEVVRFTTALRRPLHESA